MCVSVCRVVRSCALAPGSVCVLSGFPLGTLCGVDGKMGGKRSGGMEGWLLCPGMLCAVDGRRGEAE